MHGRAHNTMGLTLIEMTLVLGTMVLMVGLAVPAARSLTHSFASEGAVKSMIDAALSSARAMAMTRQRYVGVRFQKLCTSDDPANPLKGLLEAPQYMIFIISEGPKLVTSPGQPVRGLPVNGFRALDGVDPIKLPSAVGVMDPSHMSTVTVKAQVDEHLADATTFSIIFAPSGRLTVQDIRVRNREGVYQPKNDPGSSNAAHDDVFNSPENICLYHEGKFIQDDYSSDKNWLTSRDAQEYGLGAEHSLTSFAIYDATLLRAFYQHHVESPVMIDYFKRLWPGGDKVVYVNSYTGHLILPD